MLNLSLINQLFIFLAIIMGFVSAFVVLFSDKKRRINQFFFFFTVSMLLYIFFGYLSHLPSQTGNTLFLKKLFISTVSLFIIFTYFFSVYFPKEKKRYPFIDKIILITEISFIFLTIFTDFIIKGIEVESWGTNIVWGNGKIIWFGTMIVFTLIIVGQIFRKYSEGSPKEKLQTQYFLIGTIIFAILNFIFNMVFPIFKDTFKYHYFGDYSSIFFLILTAYAIVKQNLFGIRVILTSLLVGLIAILLLLDAVVFTNDLTFQLIKGLILIIFLYFGYYLIRSVLREIKLREELENAYIELKKLDMAKSEFMSIASHQLRTPLTAIKGYISMVLDGSYGPVPSKMKGKIINVFESSERLIRLVNDLLNASRIEAGKIELRVQPTSLEDIVISVHDVLALSAKNKKIYLKWEKPKVPLPKIEVDPDKIREVILNLVDNAIKYTQEGGITIGAKAEGNSVLIKISDTGAGLTQEEMAKMFKSFSRGSAGNEFFTEGLGLGLYIARQFVDLHKGKIWAESDGKNKGTTFFIVLPVKPDVQVKEFVKSF
jgi:signal transduction histidine kinase